MRFDMSALKKMSHVMRISGVDVYFHWSVFVVIVLLLLGSIERPAVCFAALGSYLGVLLIHEFGHIWFARRKGCKAYCIDIYPILGRAHFDAPWSRYDHCVIAWGGVVAQLIVAFPLVAWIVLVGYTPWEPLNAVLAILGAYSVGVAVFNLIPIAPLDGALAWGLIPEFIRRQRSRRQKGRDVGWK